MNLISRNKDCINNFSNNEKLYKNKKFPIFMGTVKSPKKMIYWLIWSGL